MYQVKLPIFEGPFDLLLHLIKKKEINIYDIPIAKITRQYLEYLRLIEALDLEVASEFLVIAALLLSIKSRMLLPKHLVTTEEEEIGEDPRLELTKKLIDYKKYKEVADELNRRLSFYQEIYTRPNELKKEETELVKCDLFELVFALQKILKEKEGKIEILQDDTSVEQKMAYLQKLLQDKEKLCFWTLFKGSEKKMDVILSFLALLELIRLKKVYVYQERLFSKIWIYRDKIKTTVQGKR